MPNVALGYTLPVNTIVLFKWALIQNSLKNVPYYQKKIIHLGLDGVIVELPVLLLWEFFIKLSPVTNALSMTLSFSERLKTCFV